MINNNKKDVDYGKKCNRKKKKSIVNKVAFGIHSFNVCQTAYHAGYQPFYKVIYTIGVLLVYYAITSMVEWLCISLIGLHNTHPYALYIY